MYKRPTSNVGVGCKRGCWGSRDAQNSKRKSCVYARKTPLPHPLPPAAARKKDTYIVHRRATSEQISFLELNDGTLALDVLDDFRRQDTLLGETHLGGEGGVGNPSGGGARGRLLQHAVDLLERETFGFGHEEVGVDEADGAEGAPDEEDLGPEVAFVLADHVGSDDGDDLEMMG